MTDAGRGKRTRLTLAAAFLALAALGLGLVLAGGDGGAVPSVRQLAPGDAWALIQKHKDDPTFLVLDVRTPEEFARGHLPGAVNVDYYRPDFRQALQAMDRNLTVLAYCHSGPRSNAAVRQLSELGFAQVLDLPGGWAAWRRAGLPTQR